MRIMDKCEKLKYFCLIYLTNFKKLLGEVHRGCESIKLDVIATNGPGPSSATLF